MRAAPAVVLAAWMAACASPDTEDTDPLNGTPDGNTSAERLEVPEQYRMVWNTTEPCLQTDEADQAHGIQVYRHSADATSTVRGDGGQLRATETWYWFHGDNSPLDCKDTFEITAELLESPLDLVGCEGCEEAWAFTRERVQAGCSYSYAGIFGLAAAEADPDLFEGVLLFDTHTSTGGAHDEGRMGITAIFHTGERDVLDPDYAIRGMTRRDAADPARPGPPATYTWVGASCIVEAL